MNFCTSEFAIFFIFIFIIYYGLNEKVSWNKLKIFLLISSYVSYSYWYYPYLLILFASTGIDYICGKKIHSTDKKNVRKRYLIISIFTNLSILGFFKYFGFFLDNITYPLILIGQYIRFEFPAFILPVGISFYTFQSMSYTIDIYRDKCKPVDRFTDLALYVAFFTQLVAGPIVRAREFIPQLIKKRRIIWPYFYWGSFLIILGSFKKLVIADNIAPYVDFFFSLEDHSDFHAITCWLYMFAYSVQIYADFSGYTDIAIGTAYLLGFKLPFNFYYPYIALGFGDFWRRWHISLSTWIRDYLYHPLGGSRNGRFITIRNLVITMFLVGLWHGANWNFVLWGLLHGFYLIIDHIVIRPVLLRFQNKKILNVFIDVIIRLFTLISVTYAWVFFRSQTLDQAIEITKSLILNFNVSNVLYQANLVIGQYWGIVYLMHFTVYIFKKDSMHRRFPKKLYFLTSLAMIIMLLFNRAVAINAFIYFQF